MKPRVPQPPTDEMCERLGANLRACRERLGVSQEELAFRMGIYRSSVGPFELGKKLPRIETFIRFVGALGVTPNELVAGISWTPGEILVTPGSFNVPNDPELAAEVAALRESDDAHRGRQHRLPGSFEVLDDPRLAAETAALRESAYDRGRRRRRG